MSDSTAPSEGNTDVSGENTDGFKPVTSQEDLDRIIENRLVRERKKFADSVSHSHFKKCEKPRHFNEKPRNFNSSGATQWRWGESVLTPPLTSANSHGSGGSCNQRATSPPTAPTPATRATLSSHSIRLSSTVLIPTLGVGQEKSSIYKTC